MSVAYAGVHTKPYPSACFQDWQVEYLERLEDLLCERHQRPEREAVTKSIFIVIGHEGCRLPSSGQPCDDGTDNKRTLGANDIHIQRLLIRPKSICTTVGDCEKR